MGQIGQIGQIGQTWANAGWSAAFLLFFFWFFVCGGFLVDHVAEGAALKCVALVVHVVELGYELFGCVGGVADFVFWLWLGHGVCLVVVES